MITQEKRIIMWLDNEYGEGNDNVKLVKSALEKQIPIKPDYWGDGYDDEGNLIYDQAKCPFCGHDFEYGINEWGSAYCQDCGQALDWGDTE